MIKSIMRIYLWLVVVLGVAVISCQKGKAIQPFQFDVTTPHQDEIADTMDIENTDNVKWSSIPEDRQKELIDAWLSNNEKHTIDEIQLFSVNLLLGYINIIMRSLFGPARRISPMPTGLWSYPIWMDCAQKIIIRKN